MTLRHQKASIRMLQVIEVGENKSSKYWLSVLIGIKTVSERNFNHCAGGLSGINEAITAAYPKSEYQRCIVYQVRHNVSYKDGKPFCANLKTEEKALERITEKWIQKYPNSMRNWKQNWDAISPVFKFSTVGRKMIFTTNAIESLNATYGILNRQRSVFPRSTAL